MPIIALEELVYCCPYVHHHNNDVIFKQYVQMGFMRFDLSLLEHYTPGSPLDCRSVLNRPIHYEIMRTLITFVPCAMTHTVT